MLLCNIICVSSFFCYVVCIVGAHTIEMGHYKVFDECAENEVQLGGERNVTCLEDGTLSANPLYCATIGNV